MSTWRGSSPDSSTVCGDPAVQRGVAQRVRGEVDGDVAVRGQRAGLAQREGVPQRAAQRPAVQVGCEADLLGDRHEPVRRDLAADRVGPAREGLDAHDPAGAQVDDGLVVQLQAVVGQRHAQVAAELVALPDPGGEAGVEDLHPVPAGHLGGVHRGVRLVEQRARRRGRRECDSDRGGQVDLALGHPERLVEGHEQPLGQQPGGVHVDVLADHQELVPGEPGDRVGRVGGLPQPGRHPHQQLVAGGVAPDVVDALELVEVDEEHRGGPGLPGQRVLEAVEEQGAVGQPGEGVVQRGPAQLVLQPSGVGDVDDHRQGPLEGAADVVERCSGDQQGAPASVRVLVADLVALGPAALPGRLLGLAQPAVRVEHVEQRTLVDRVGADAQDLEQPVVDVDGALVRREHPQALVGVVGDGAVARLRRPQGRLGADPVVDVAQVPQHAADGGVEQVARRRLHPAPPPRGVADPQGERLGAAVVQHPVEQGGRCRRVVGVDELGAGDAAEVLGRVAEQLGQRR